MNKLIKEVCVHQPQAKPFVNIYKKSPVLCNFLQRLGFCFGL
ncbi:hypothetical protein HMPREF0322_01134 [Desulfitobacterium hafniense DP7]|uniref:Uncharacterized protein n=1 Tax=Desulfitobacterium hafniense DP7 TaxID=537010 RepID=G9XJK3_DESHA|nr:hypothetical protein HMPREF0322_01134 [Desulfitobacterium hafniense DP7]